MFMDKKTYYCKNVILPKLINRLNVILVKKLQESILLNLI
jgi:hypothetical protein